jgi:hypothetical protein
MLGNRAVAPYESMASHRLSHAAKHKFYPVPGIELPLLKETPACKDLNNIIEADHGGTEASHSPLGEAFR